MRPRNIVLLVAACSLAAAEPRGLASEQAAPEIMLFHGDALGRRVFLPKWEENHRFLLSVIDSPLVTVRELENRRSFSVAMFWGMTWRSYTRNAEALAKLDPAQANQQARFYPVQGGLGPVIVFTGQRGERQMRRVREEGLQILAQRGVPVDLTR